jgi:hypothetical protein
VIEMALHHRGLSSRFAAEGLGFSPRPAEETLTDTIAWPRSHVLSADPKAHPSMHRGKQGPETTKAAPQRSRSAANGREPRPSRAFAITGLQ